MRKNLYKYFSLFLLTIIFFNILLPPTITSCNEKIIYLTFDDGPGGKVTNDILDILKKEEVPATFFLIGSQIENQEDLIKRIHSEGHSLGLHSMSHDKQKLYYNNDLFLKEMLETQKIIKDITGVNSNILRFPFGCNNNCYKLNKTLVDLLHKNNFKIYDWNVDSTDGANSYANPSLFIKKATSDKSPIILLMHCGYINKNSTIALPEIIKYYKSQGYTFKKIDNDTPEEYHYITNR